MGFFPAAVDYAIRNKNADKTYQPFLRVPPRKPACVTEVLRQSRGNRSTETPFSSFHLQWLLVASLSLPLLAHVSAVPSFTCGLMGTVSAGPYHHLGQYHDPYFGQELMRLSGEGLSRACSWGEDGPGPAAVPSPAQSPGRADVWGLSALLGSKDKSCPLALVVAFLGLALEKQALT